MKPNSQVFLMILTLIGAMSGYLVFQGSDEEPHALQTRESKSAPVQKQAISLTTHKAETQTDAIPIVLGLHQRFKALARKALPTRSERSELERLLSDDRLIDSAKNALLSASLANENERLEATKYLVRALDWTTNPARKLVIEAISDIVIHENIKPGDSLELKRSIAGDKVELFAELAETDPNAALDLRRRASARNEKILAFAEGLTKNQKEIQ